MTREDKLRRVMLADQESMRAAIRQRHGSIDKVAVVRTRKPMPTVAQVLALRASADAAEGAGYERWGRAYKTVRAAALAAEREGARA